MDAELDALIVVEPPEPDIPTLRPAAAAPDVERILRAYRAAKRQLELLDQQEASEGPSPASGTDYALERHLTQERVRALKYDLTSAVRGQRPRE